jgi:hypothetical protein
MPARQQHVYLGTNQRALTAHLQRHNSHETDPILGPTRTTHVCITILRCMKPDWAYFKYIIITMNSELKGCSH